MPDRGATALDDALSLLGRRDHFRAELTSKLLDRGHAMEEAELAVAICVQRGWVDDEALAHRFVQWRGPNNGWGPHRLRQELLRRGVDESLISEAVAMDAEVAEAALRTALRRAERRAKPGWWRSGEGRARMVSSLLRRGFDAEDARRAVEHLAEETETQDNEG
jgi:regulatory protein